MNNLYFSFLLCLTALTFAPACKKKTTPSKEIKKTIEIENTVLEIEKTDNEEKLVIKF